MVGRGAQGRPWLLAQIAAKPVGPPGAACAARGRTGRLGRARHYDAMLGFYGRDLGLRVARKHLGWYADAAGGCALARRAALTATNPAQVLALLPDLLAPMQEVAA